MGEAILERSRVNPRDVALFIPPNLKRFKLDLFERIGRHIIAMGGRTIRHEYAAINRLPDEIIPIVGCTPEFRGYIADWVKRKRTWIYWDRGYFRRRFSTWLPYGRDLGHGFLEGFFRWHLNRPQMGEIYDVPSDRWKFLRIEHVVKPWNKNGKHIVVADTLPDYWNLFSDPEWTKRTVAELKKYTDRKIVIRDKLSSKPLYEELKDAHCLVAHGSIAAVESVVMGCPVFVDPLSAASLVGRTKLQDIESPLYSERQAWFHSLAYCQFHEQELIDGTLWRLIR